MPKYVGFTPYSHQQAVIDELVDAKGTGKRVCVKSSRQKGKSYMVANLLLYFALNNTRANVFCVSPTLKQAKAIYKVIVDAVPSNLMLYNNATELVITFRGCKSTINFKSAEQGQALRGYCADFVCIDEAAFISDDIFYLINPWTDVKKAPMLIVSTPFIKSGFFYQYYNMGLARENNTVTVDWCDPRFAADMEAILPRERLEEYRRILPHNQFLTEYLGEWLDDDGTVFIGFKNCIEYHTLTPKSKLYVGIDWANGVDGDSTVLSILDEHAHQVYLSYWNDLTPTQQVDAIVSVLSPLEKQIVSIQPELNSIGTPYTDMLKTRLQESTRRKIEGFNTTNQSKNEIVTELQVAFENGGITILDDPRQSREVGVYSAEYNPKTKNISYNAPRGLHDDTVIALMLAHHALKNKKSSGRYSISVL